MGPTFDFHDEAYPHNRITLPRDYASYINASKLSNDLAVFLDRQLIDSDVKTFSQFNSVQKDRKINEERKYNAFI